MPRSDHRVLAIGVEAIDWAEHHLNADEELTAFKFSAEQVVFGPRAPGYHLIVLDAIFGVYVERLKSLARHPGDMIKVISLGQLTYEYETPFPENAEIGRRGRR